MVCTGCILLLSSPLGYVYTTTIPPVSAIIPVKYVAVTPRVYTVTVKTIPVSANICIRKQKREFSYPVSNRPRVKVNFGSILVKWAAMRSRMSAYLLRTDSQSMHSALFSVFYSSVMLRRSSASSSVQEKCSRLAIARSSSLKFSFTSK